MLEPQEDESQTLGTSSLANKIEERTGGSI